MAMDERVAGAQARVGAVLARKYRLERVLGIGGMASVYEAVHLRNGNRVAIKVLHRELAVEAYVRARFVREGYASNAVGHAGAVRVLDDDVSEDGTVFLVMDLLEGETLDERRERRGRRLAMAEVTRWTWQVLDVLAVAHAKGIVHRDRKPQNLFLTRDGAPKVLDFGMASGGAAVDHDPVGDGHRNAAAHAAGAGARTASRDRLALGRSTTTASAAGPLDAGPARTVVRSVAPRPIATQTTAARSASPRDPLAP